MIDLVEGRWSLWSVQLLGLLDSVWKWELQVLGQELSDVLSLDIIFGFKFNNLQNVNRSKSSSVSSSQVRVHGFDSTNSGNISVFLVHVVGTRSRVVSDPDTKVLDLGWLVFRDDVQRNNFTRSLLNLVQLLQKVPVSGLSNNVVWCKNSHSVQLWFWNSFGRKSSTDNLVFI